MANGVSGNLPVTLGSLELTGLEVPDAYDRAGTMQPVVHRLIGGGRVVQLLGPDPGRRRLQGYFTGPRATERAQLLEALRDSGDRILLTIGVWQEFVAVTSVVLRYAAQGSIVQYILEAEPLPGGAAGLVATAAAVLATIGTQLALAASDAALVGSSASTSGLASAALAVNAAQSSMSTPSIDLTPVSTALTADTVTNEASMAAIVEAAPDGSLVASSSALSSATSTAATLAASVNAQAYTTCAASNLALLQTGSS